MMNPKMNPEWKQKWIEALRSGNYKQGHQYLRKDEEDGSISYCCLGVLCDIAGVDWIKTPEYSISKGEAYRPHFEGRPSNESLLPRSIVHMTGLLSDSPKISGMPVSTMNDIRGMTFEQISLEIELNL